MIIKSYSSLWPSSKNFLFLPILGLLTLTFCTQKTDYTNLDFSTTYSDVELHMDPDRSEELEVYFGAQYTSSGELFTGTQRVYHKESDSLHMELYYNEGINTGSLMNKDGDVYRNTLRINKNAPYLREMYVNGILNYQDIPPTEREDGLGQVRIWHENGQLALEAFYSGFTGNKLDQGPMTEYDEEGNITLQERYEDGELIEKIK